MAQSVIVFGVDGLIPELVYKFSREGALPHITRLMEDGASAELLPYISTWGDVNWVSFLTGQSPGTSWKGQRIPPVNHDNLLGAMERQGKRCALVHFPESLSTAGTRHFHFAPFWSGNGSAPFELAAPTIYTTDMVKWSKSDKQEFLGWPPVDTLAYHEKGNCKPVARDESGYTFTMHMNDGTHAAMRALPQPCDDGSRCDDPTAGLDGSADLSLVFPDGETLPLRVNEWSDWSIRTLNKQTGYVRYKLLKYDEQTQQLDLLQSQMTSTAGIANDAWLEQQILEQVGPFISKWALPASPDVLYHDTSFEEGAYQAEWLAKTALLLVNENRFDLFATVYRLNDETHHTSLGEYDPASPFYSEERAGVCEDILRRSYKVLDQAIGLLLRGKSPDTMLIVASDHGDVPNAYLCDIYQRLAQYELVQLDANGLPVLERSKAFLKNERGGMEIFVNVRGRQRNGIVEASEYEKVQTEIFHALSTWYYDDPQTGCKTNVIGIVLKKNDAAMIGYWGEEMGDVIFAYNQGFVWGFNHNRDIVAPITAPSANHGPQIPTARTKHSSNLGIAMLHGPTIRQGVQGRHRERGSCAAPYKMNDMGATIAHVLGLSDTGGLDGRPLHDLLRL